MITKADIQRMVASYFVGKPVLRAYLFGSFARDEADENSDIDVLVELDYASGGADFGNYLTMMNDLAERLGRKVDLVSAKGLSQFVAPYIHADNISTETKQKAGAIDWRKIKAFRNLPFTNISGLTVQSFSKSFPRTSPNWNRSCRF